VRIALGKGVCGTAAVTRQTQRVADVEDFPGHIPCDSASRSELVVPLFDARGLIGVFDSTARARSLRRGRQPAGAPRRMFVESLR
jgi:GAF domain-containing protein